MKVVHISTYPFGGAAGASFRLHESLNKKINSAILQSCPVSPEQKDKGIEQCTVFHSLNYRILKKLNLLPYLSKIERLNKKIKEQHGKYDFISLPFSYYPIHLHPLVQDADIIHLHWVSDFLNYPTFFKSIKQPIVWTLHDINPFMGIYHYLGDKDRNGKLSVLNEIDENLRKLKKSNIHLKKDINVICPSKWMYDKSIISPTFKHYAHQIIPIGFNIDNFDFKDRNLSKKEMKVNNGRKTLLFGADDLSHRGKGVDLLIKALERTPKDQYNLLCFGNGDLNQYFKQYPHFKHLGFISNHDTLNTIYSAADVTIIPSREDSFNQIMAESMLNGTPVISYNIGGMADYIKNDMNGILTYEMNSKALANSINNFIENRIIFNPEQIREYAISNFDNNRIAESYLSLYNNILKK